MANLEQWRAAPTRGGAPILAFESSCDETAAAVLTGTRELRSSVVHSQIDIHAQYGGVVPELASRAHILAIEEVTRRALADAEMTLADIRGIAVTRGPGLVGSLLVGLEFAKGIAASRDIPLVGVNHLQGHLMAPFLRITEGFAEPEFPFVGLVVSGGHTSLYVVEGPDEISELGRTLDDAAGEAFDKVSKRLGLGYPGGPVIDRRAEAGDPAAIDMPRPMLKKPGYHFSFSGLKTAVGYYLDDAGELDDAGVADLCASFREAACEVLAIKTVRAARKREIPRIVLSGGVACNRRLRQLVRERAERRGIEVVVPPPSLCTDNAAMIGAAGYADVHARIVAGQGFEGGAVNATSTWPLGERARTRS